MATAENPPKDGAQVQLRNPRPTNADGPSRESSKPRESRASGRTSDTGQASKGQLMVRKFNMTDEIKNYTNKLAFYIAIAQIIIGTLFIILGIISLVVKCAGSESVVGIWGGVIIVVAGIVGILAYKRRIANLIVTCFAFGLISIVIGGTILVMSGAFLGMDLNLQRKYTEEIDFWPAGSKKSESSRAAADAMGPRIAVDAVMLIVAIVEIVVAIIQAIVAGKVLIVRGVKRRQGEGQTGTRLTAIGEDSEWGEYNPPPKTRTVSEAEADQEFGEYDPARAPTKRSSYRGSKHGYAPVQKEVAEAGDGAGGAAAAADVAVEIHGASASAGVSLDVNAGTGEYTSS